MPQEGAVASGVAHHDLVVRSIVVVERPAVSCPDEQKTYPLTVVMTKIVGVGCVVEDATTVALAVLFLGRPEARDRLER